MEITEAAILEAILAAAQTGESDRQGLRMEEIVNAVDGMSANAARRLVRQLVKAGKLRPRNITFVAFHGRPASGIEYVLVEGD